MRRRRRRIQTLVVPLAPAPHPGSETDGRGTRGERRRGREQIFVFVFFGFLGNDGGVSRSGGCLLTTNDKGYASSSDLGSADVRYQCPGDVPHSALLFSTVLNHSTDPSGHMSRPLKPKLLPKLQRSDPPPLGNGGAHAIVSNTIVVHSDANRHRIPHHAAPSTVCWRVTRTCIPIGARRSATSHLLKKTRRHTNCPYVK